MRTHLTKAAIAALTAAATSTLAVPTALAQPATHPAVTTVRFEHDQQALEQAIIGRQVQLAYLATKITDAANVTPSDRTALDNTITTEQTALAGYATDTAAATTLAEVDTVRNEVVANERVYVVVSAQTNMVIKADNDTVLEAGFTNLVPTLTPLVTELGNNTASTLLANITTQVNAATSETNGVSAGALALTPAAYTASAGQMSAWNSRLDQAAKHLAVANSDVRAIEGIALNEHRLPIVRNR